MDRKWDDLSEVMWGAMAIELAPPDRRPRRAGRGGRACPMLVIVGEQDSRSSARRSDMADAIAGAELVDHPRRRALAAVRESRTAWIDALTRFLATVPTRLRAGSSRLVDAHGGRLAVEVLRRARRRHDVHAVGRSPLRALRRRGADRPPPRRRPPRADARRSRPKGSRRSRAALGCAALTAGPGVTNGVSALTAARMNGSPMVVIGGRAPQARWGAGSLQELDHVPIVASVTKTAATATSAASIVAEVDAACRAARTPHRGPTFVDIPLDVFGPGSVDVPAVAGADAFRGRDTRPRRGRPRSRSSSRGSERPVLVAGGDVYWARAEDADARASRRRRACRCS